MIAPAKQARRQANPATPIGKHFNVAGCGTGNERDQIRSQKIHPEKDEPKGNRADQIPGPSHEKNCCLPTNKVNRRNCGRSVPVLHALHPAVPIDPDPADFAGIFPFGPGGGVDSAPKQVEKFLFDVVEMNSLDGVRAVFGLPRERAVNGPRRSPRRGHQLTTLPAPVGHQHFANPGLNLVPGHKLELGLARRRQISRPLDRYIFAGSRFFIEPIRADA